MRKPRTNILLLTIIFVVVGLVGQAWLAGRPAVTTSAALNGEAVVSPVTSFENTSSAAAKALDRPVGLQISADLFQGTPTASLSPDANVLVAEMCQLQLMSEGTDFALGSDQWSAFATVVLRFQAITRTYEVQIANLKVITPGRYRVEIPMYARVGDELREQFSKELRAALGEPTAREVMAKLGDRLERRFAGFGVSVQTLDITANPLAESCDIQVARTVSYWNSMEGGDRLSTRREIYFPLLEDPTGDSWSALFAKMESASQANGPG